MVSYDRFQAKLEWMRKWSKMHPKLKTRLERAIFLRVDPTSDPDVYKVRSETNPDNWYTIRVFRQARKSTCTCKDRASRCKHRLAVTMHEKTSSTGGTDPAC